MRLNRKFLRRTVVPGVWLVGAGCSGINASKSISPLDFFMPGGLLQTEPPPAHPDSPLPDAKPAIEVVQF